MTIKSEGNRLIIGKDSFAIEKLLVKKLDRVIRGITQENPKEDALLINEGQEGKGKTNSSIVEASYVKSKTGRDIHLFFKLEMLMEFAQKTSKKIIIWDEPSLDSLSSDQITKLNKNMQRLFMVIRKKRHFFIINYTKFWKFPEYIVVDRANGMLKMRDDSIGRFFYIRKKSLEKLWNDKKKSNKRNYHKYKSFGGSIPNIMERCFDSIGINVNNISNATYQDYEHEKDLAILSVGKKDQKGKREVVDELRMKIGRGRKALIKALGINITQQLYANAFGMHRRTFIDCENKAMS